MIDFLRNESFVKMVRQTDVDSGHYWQRWLEKNLERKEDFEF